MSNDTKYIGGRVSNTIVHVRGRVSNITLGIWVTHVPTNLHDPQLSHETLI